METVILARQAMATRFEIILHGDNSVRLRATGEEALDEIERLEAQLSLYRRTSEISQINARAAHGPLRVEPTLFRLLQRAKGLSDESAGTFDITVAPLVRCWGFMGGTGAMPDPTQIADARSKVGMHLVTLRERDFTVQFEREGVMLDLGAIGKGYALDRAAEILKDNGVTSALLHGGTSTIYAIGKPPEGDWKIAIDAPGETCPNRISRIEPMSVPLSRPSAFAKAMADKADTLSPSEGDGGRGSVHGEGTVASSEESRQIANPVAVVRLHDEALSVSAPHGKFFQAGGRILGHVLDPRTGEPAQAALLAAVVLPSSADSDALSTALLTLGPGGHELLARARPTMRSLMIARDASGTLSVQNIGMS